MRPMKSATSVPPIIISSPSSNHSRTIYNVETENVACDEATKVAEAWERDCLGPPGACTASSYDCDSKATGEASETTCVKGDAEVRFVFASFDPQ